MSAPAGIIGLDSVLIDNIKNGITVLYRKGQMKHGENREWLIYDTENKKIVGNIRVGRIVVHTTANVAASDMSKFGVTPLRFHDDTGDARYCSLMYIVGSYFVPSGGIDLPGGVKPPGVRTYRYIGSDEAVFSETCRALGLMEPGSFRVPEGNTVFEWEQWHGNVFRGLSAEEKRAFMQSEYYDRLREVVRKRDNGRCCRCKNPGTQVHHIVRRSLDTEGLADIRNLVLMCDVCHELTSGITKRLQAVSVPAGVERAEA